MGLLDYGHFGHVLYTHQFHRLLEVEEVVSFGGHNFLNNFREN